MKALAWAPHGLVRLIAGVLAFAALIGTYMYCTSVEKTVTAADEIALASIEVIRTSPPRTFDEEVTVIRHLQHRLLRKVTVDNSNPISGEPVEPAELLSRGRGACYELSRTLEKALALNGLESRRVFLLYRQDRQFLSALVTRGHPSHAAVEVMTSKGWLLVDSIYPWISLDKQGIPVPANGIWNHVDRFDTVPEHLRLSSWAIRGMYSRNGQLYGSHLPGPEMNWPDFSAWLLSPHEDRHLH